MRVLVLLMIAGCGFERQGASVDLAPDFASADLAVSDDLSSGDLSANDLTAVDLARPVDLGPPCAPPILYVAVDRASGAGKILRYSLGANATPTACASLSGGGDLPSHARVVTPIGSARVAVATDEAVYLIDHATDAILWRWPHPLDSGNLPLVPIDLFDANNLVGVGYAQPANPQDIDRVVVLDGSAAPLRNRRFDGVDLVPQGVKSLSTHPTKRSTFLALVLGGAMQSSAMEVDPASGMSKSLASCCGTGVYLTLAAANFLGSEHVVWATETSNMVLASHYMDDLSGGGLPSGPATCSAIHCKMIHAVPDPTQARGILGLCGETSPRKVYRFDSFGQGCNVIVDGATASDGDLARLGLGL